MLKHSRIALVIKLKEPTGKEVTKYLGISPSVIKEYKMRSGKPGHEPKITLSHSWQLDSPKDQNFPPIERLEALVDVIAPFSERLISLDSAYTRRIDLLFHLIPERPDGKITGSFDWFMLPPLLMSKLGAWNLVLSYETIWFEQ